MRGRAGLQASRRAARPAILAAGWLASACIMAAPAPAPAAPSSGWVLEPAGSVVEFDYLLEGKPGQGVFRRFAGGGSFDPDRPEAARLTLTIESGSVDFGRDIVNAFATSSEGFDSRNHPHITYRLTGLEPLGADAYLARGVVTIKGREQALETRVTLSVTPDAARAEGRLEVDRLRFGLGVGPFSSMIDLAPAVGVHFILNARPGEPRGRAEQEGPP